VLEQTVGVPLMKIGQLGIHRWGYTAVEYVLGIAAIAAVIEIAKLM
jgi:hypothetical protein